MSASVLLTITCIFSWYRVLPNHLRALGATEAQVGIAFMILTLGNRIPQILGGFIADRFGRKRILVVATLLMAPFYALTALMTTWTAALAALSACWAVSALLGPSIITIVSESVPEERRGQAIGRLETCIMVAVTIGPLFGSWILRRFEFGRAMTILLLTTASIYVIVAALRATFLVETHAPAERPKWSEARLAPLFWIVPIGILVYATYFLSTDGPFFALYGRDIVGLHEAGINEVFFLGGLAALATAVVGGEIVDRMGSHRVLTLTFLAMFAMLAPFAWAWWNHRPMPLGLDYVLFVLLFAPGELFVIAYQKTLTSSAPKEHRALHVGLASAATGVVASLANWAGGAVYAGSPAGPFAFGAACAAVGTVVSIALWRAEWLRRPSTASAA